MSKYLRLYLEMAEETKRLTMEGLEFNAALRKVKEMYKEKAQSQATNLGKEHNKLFNDIITNAEGLDKEDLWKHSKYY